MVKNAYIKLMLRGIRKSTARFLSILLIVAIGVGFLGGLLATTPDMQKTADKYYDDYKAYDFDVKGTLGLTNEDIEAVSALEGVERALGVHCADLSMKNEDGIYTVRIYGVDFDKINSEDFIGGFEVISGEVPQGEGECLLCVPNHYRDAHSVGEEYSVSEDNRNYENIDEILGCLDYRVTGIVRSPLYMSIESEPTTAGSGSVELIMYVPDKCFNYSVFTDAFIILDGTTAINCFDDEYSDRLEEFSSTLSLLAEERNELRYNEIQEEAKNELDRAKKEYEDKKQETKSALANAESELKKAQEEIDRAKAEYQSSKTAYEQSRDTIQLRQTEITEEAARRRDELNASRAYMTPEQYSAASDRIDEAESEGWEQISAAVDELDDAALALGSAKAEIDKNQAELDDAAEEYEKSVQTAEEELDAANEKIEDAEKSIGELEKPSWYISDRTDTAAYSSFKGDSEKVAAIARVFPVFFFLVAALVALTTMTRMVEEERTQTGTLKALGYSDRAIIFYYAAYSVIASVAGGFIGIIPGFKVLPYVISGAYGMMYDLPKTVTPFYGGYAAVIIPMAVAVTSLAALFACVGQLCEKPSELMLPRPPKAGKRILLERVGFIWKHMKFTQKVTFRNLFRYKKRLFMTVTGVAGCCALLVCGFGLRDSIHDIADKQFDELYMYDMTVRLKEVSSEDGAARVLSESENVTGYSYIHGESGSLQTDRGKNDVSIIIPEVNSELKERINLRSRKTGEDIPFEEDSLVLTEKLCETLGIGVGDRVSITNADKKTAELTVTGICENYVTAYAFMPQEVYQREFGASPEYNMIFAAIANTSKEAREQLSKRILECSDAMLVSFTETIRENFSNTVKSIDSIVFVLIAAAGLLAVVVLYNLTNINICERRKELATIKVLGFHEGETAAYIYKETAWLCAIGTIAGFGFGKSLHSFVVHTVEIDGIMFGRGINFTSYLLAAAVTFIFTALVDLIMLKKLSDINMAESMKANE